MKKIFLFAFVITATLLVAQLPTAVSAAGTVTIGGTVTNGGVPIKNVPVKVLVNDTPLAPIKTNDNGEYTINTNNTIVPPGSKVVIEIDTNDDGMPDGRYEDILRSDIIDFDLDTNPIPVPEYSWLGAMGATGVGLGFIAWQRRQRQALVHE
jgi:hypothetical protein